jgi:Protein of unknown function (DUF3107)
MGRARNPAPAGEGPPADDALALGEDTTGSARMAGSRHVLEGHAVEVKVGVQNAARELILESGQSADEIEKAVATALGKSGGILSLADERGRKVLIPADRLAYVEIGEQVERRVGFGAM